MSTIKLQGNDEVPKPPIVVDLKTACCSGLIKSILDNVGHPEGDENEVIPVAHINDATLRKVFEWAEYHKDDPPPLVPSEEDDENVVSPTDDISAWDADYLRVDRVTLLELILAANYLDVKGLLDLTCKALANIIKESTVEEIRSSFNIQNDFTPAEEELVRQENDWCQDK